MARSANDQAAPWPRAVGTSGVTVTGSAGAATGPTSSASSVHGGTLIPALVREEARNASDGEALVDHDPSHVKSQGPSQPTLMDGGVGEGPVHDNLDVAMTRSQHRRLASSPTAHGTTIEALREGDDIASVSARLASMASKQESLVRAVADQDDKLTRILALLSRSGV